MIRNRATVLLVVACSFGAWQSWRWREQPQTPGVKVAVSPHQAEDADPSLAAFGRYQLTRKARYEIDARLLSRRRYRLDAGADLAPLDFAVGWGPMSDTAVLDGLSISQSGRFFRVRWDAERDMPSDWMSSAANMHLIPATDRIESRLDSMRPGQIIRLRGWLVDAARDDGWQWKTSLTRDDSGHGACELMWVDDASVLN